MYANFSQKKAREDQFTQILDFITQQGSREDWRIVGGDFNTFFESNNQMIEYQIQKHGFFDITKTIPITFFGIWDMKLDYLFFNQSLNMIEAGTITDCSASDHIPIWAFIPTDIKN